MRLCCAVAVVLVSLNAAIAGAQDRQWGGKAGVTVSANQYRTSSDNPGFHNRVAASGGGFFVEPIVGALALQLEALYLSKGAENASKDTLDTTETLKLDYIDVPALARVTFVRAASHSIYAFGGPVPGFRISAKHSTSVGRPVRSGETVDIKDAVEFFEFSVLAGIGADIGGHGVLDARYEWGLTNVVKDVPDEHTIRNRAFTVLVGIRF
jgi:Outer membrane protein beta-barrel domain